MEHFINVIFEKNLLKESHQGVIDILLSTANSKLYENEMFYETFETSKNASVIQFPLPESVDSRNADFIAEKIANKLFDAGYTNFDLEITLNEGNLTTFEPWRDQIEALGYTITPSGRNVRNAQGTVAGINDNGNLWSGSQRISDIVNNPPSTSQPTTAQPSAQAPTSTGANALRDFSQSGRGGLANDRNEREAIVQLQQRLIDLGYDLGPMGADGIYGRRTIAAVRAYQEANGLRVDGDAGPETIGHMLSSRAQGAADAAIDRRMDGDAAATRQPSDTDEPEDEAEPAPQTDAELDADSEDNAEPETEFTPRELSDRPTEAEMRIIINDLGGEQFSFQRWTIPSEDAERLGGRFILEIVLAENPETVREGRTTGEAIINRMRENLTGGPRFDVEIKGPNGQTYYRQDQLLLSQSDEEEPETPEAPAPEAPAPEAPAPEDETDAQAPEDETDAQAPEDDEETEAEPGEEEAETEEPSTEHEDTDDQGYPTLESMLNIELVPESSSRPIYRVTVSPIVGTNGALTGYTQSSVNRGSIDEQDREQYNRYLSLVPDGIGTSWTNQSRPFTYYVGYWRFWRVGSNENNVWDTPFTNETVTNAIIQYANSRGFSPTDASVNVEFDSLEAAQENIATLEPGTYDIGGQEAELRDENGQRQFVNPSTGQPFAIDIEALTDSFRDEINAWNVDEEAVINLLGYVTDKEMLDEIADTYSSEFGDDFFDDLISGFAGGGGRGQQEDRAAFDTAIERLGYRVTWNGLRNSSVAPITQDEPETATESVVRKTDVIDEETYNGDEFYEAYGDLWYNDDEVIDEAEYRGRKVKLGKPMKGDVKKFKVYVKNPKGNVVKVNFGDPNMRIKKSNPKRRKSFRARHNCDNPGPRHKARYWSCRKW